MTVATETNRTIAQGNGVTTVFTYNFIIPSATDAVIIYTNAAGTQTILTSTQYTITGIGDSAGGTVTYPLGSGTPIATGASLTILRELPLTQPDTISNQGAFYPSVVEEMIDNTVMMIQQINTDTDLALRVALSDPVPDTLPSAAERADQLLGFDSDGNPIAAQPSSALVSAAWQPVVDSATLAAGLALLGINPAALPALLGPAYNAGGITNAYLVESHTGNAATFALRTLAAAVPSSTDFGGIVTRSATATSGAYTPASIATDTTVTIPSGATMGVTPANVAFRLWFVLFSDGQLGVIQPTRVDTNPFITITSLANGQIVSATAMSTGADNANTFYATSTVTSKAYSIIGYADYASGLATPGAWASSPTKIQMFGPGVQTPGQIVGSRYVGQAASTNGTTVVPLDNTIPQSGEGVIAANCAYVPTAAANILKVQAALTASLSITATSFVVFLCVVGNAAFVSTVANRVGTADLVSTVPITGFYRANGSISQTLELRAGPPSAGTIYFNGTSGGALMGNTMQTYIEVIEIMA